MTRKINRRTMLKATGASVTLAGLGLASPVVHSAKINEIAEGRTPDKLVTLQMLIKDKKKSLNYNVEEVEKGIIITDHIHGEANIIIKGDMDGFTIYGFEQDNLMAKNALMDLDLWKEQAEVLWYKPVLI